MEQLALSRDHRRAILIQVAREWVGLTEQGGNNQGQVVELFQRAVDGISSGEPWCAGFVFHCIDQTDGILAALGDPVPSPLFHSEHCMTAWERASAHLRKPLADHLPEPGDLMVWNHYRNGEPTRAGHIGIVASYAGEGVVHTIEGNTSDGEGVVREGDGVYERVRYITGDGDMRCVGFLRSYP